MPTITTEVKSESTKRIPASLDRRIAAALADENTDRVTFINLWQEAIDEVERLKHTIEIETQNARDIANCDPDLSANAVERAKLGAERLAAATHKIKSRVGKIDFHARCVAWDSEYQQIVKEREALIAELLTATETIKHLADLFNRIEQFDRQRLPQLHGCAPEGENRRLRTVELEAYDLDHFTLESPSIVKNLRLPDPSNPNHILYPREDPFWSGSSNVMVAAAQALERRQALTFGPDWHEARKLQDQERREEIARVEAEEKLRREKEQQEYYDSMRRHDEMRRTGVRPNGGVK